MPRAYCTLFDSNYLTRGLALYESLRSHEPGAGLRVFCMDRQTKTVLDRLQLPGLQAIGLEELERHDPELRAVKSDRTPLEYCWTATPSVALYCLERDPEIDAITYLDADVYFYSSAQPLFDEMGSDAVMIVPHRYGSERAHLAETSGIYNVELVSFRRDDDGLEALRWWRDRCIEWCYYRVEDGKLGDQKYLDDWPERFRRVHVLEHVGGGLAPWNVDRYRLHDRDGDVFVDDLPLVFYHFHSLQLYRDRRFRRGDTHGGAARFDAGEESFGWTSGYVPSDEAQRLVWDPYLRALASALSLVRSVEPGFEPGPRDPADFVRFWGRSQVGGASRRARELARALKKVGVGLG
jgi:hypothetical protein